MRKLPGVIALAIGLVATAGQAAWSQSAGAYPTRPVRWIVGFPPGGLGDIVGSSNHITGELFKIMAGIDMVHVPYRGSAPALTDLLGGQVEVMFDNLLSSIEYVRTGRLRALAVTTASRSPALPEVPMVGEFLPGLEASIWQGIGVPKNTPPEIIEKLNKEINLALADPKMKKRFADLGSIPFPTTPAEFGEFIAGETEKWAKVIRSANIKAE
jgi:tripartite-type tricarboxylate transporter receptor subunit TctC